MLACRVAVQNLQKKHLDRDDRVEHRIVPGHACLAASLGDRVHGKFVCSVLLEATNNIRNTVHGGASCREWNW